MKFLYDDHVVKYDIYSEIVAVVVILKSSRLSKKMESFIKDFQ